MQAILDNIDAGVKAGLEKARKANTVEPFVGFDIGDVCEMPDGRIGLVTGYHSDDRNVWVTPWDETKEIKFGWDEIAEHWKKPNASGELPAGAESGSTPPALLDCGCASCQKLAWWMIVCDVCGNKRCPHAENHIYKCTGSNELNQTKTLIQSNAEAHGRRSRRTVDGIVGDSE